MITVKHTKKLNSNQDVIVPCFKGKLNALKPFVDIKSLDFSGEFSTLQVLYTSNGQKVYALGLGEKKHEPKLQDAFRKFAFETKKHWKSTLQVFADNLSDLQLHKAVVGLQMADYEIGQYKSEKVKDTTLTINFVSAKNIAPVLSEASEIGKTINRIKALVDAPANIKTPEFLGKWALDSAKENNFKCSVFDEKELKKQGFHAVLSVGKGSENPPVVIVMEHKPRPKDAIDIALVGKGITFDTGGLSIKSSTNLHYMKSDMGGSAVVLGVMELVAKLNLNVNVVGVVASAENSVDAKSYRPSDVIDSYSGKTIEIIDTDAEGRLALADGLNYVITQHKPNQVIDLATLTGSVVQTLGYSAAGMFTHDKQMASKMTTIGELLNERVWPLPLFEDYESDLQSDVADIRNFSGKPVAGAINAAKFLEAFTNSHKKWMHLDIAGVAFGDSPYAKMKSATGYGVQLILQYIKTLN